jgi:hypothetical protein
MKASGGLYTLRRFFLFLKIPSRGFSYTKGGQNEKVSGKTNPAHLELQEKKNALKGGKTMKPRNFILLCGVLLLAIALVDSYATKRKAISEKDLTEAYTGTWINPKDYYKPKRILYPGKWEEYTNIESKKPYCYGDIELMQKWTNSKGVIFFEYKFKCMTHGNIGYELVRISDSGNTMEILYTKSEKRVEEWEPDNYSYTYKIYYRQ